MRGGDALDQGENFLHLGASRDDVRIVVALAERFAQRAVLFPKLAHVELFVNDHAHFGERERLQYVIARAGFHGFNGGLHRAVCRHDDDGQI